MLRSIFFFLIPQHCILKEHFNILFSLRSLCLSADKWMDGNSLLWHGNPHQLQPVSTLLEKI